MSTQPVEPFRAMLVLEFRFTDGPASVEAIRDYILARIVLDDDAPPDVATVVTGAIADKIAEVIEYSGSTRH